MVNLKYHFVWIPKHRKHLLVGDVAEATKEILCEAAEAYGMDVDTLVAREQIHPCR